MISDAETINLVLSHADNIFHIEGGKSFFLAYDNNELVISKPLGSLVHKHISEVRKIIFHSDIGSVGNLGAWEVIWRV